MPLSLPTPLSQLVETKHLAAKANQSLIFSPTSVTTIHTTTHIPFQLRYCPALSKKPTAIKQDPNNAISTTKKPNPFETPHPDLLITSLPPKTPTHNLILNKFPVIPSHFILATKPYKPQTAELEQDDLEMTYQCLEAWEEHESAGRLFAFFNSGPHSGASQPHRHIQFLPIDSMKNGLPQPSEWSLLLDIISQTPTAQDLPFSIYTTPLPAHPSASTLHKIYKSLYARAATALQNNDPISYNLALTTSTMALCPRLSEGGMLHRPDGSEIGFVALNGTVLGGTLMVKGEEEWEVLRARPEVLDGLLAGIGVPRGRGDGDGEGQQAGVRGTL